MSPTCTTIAGMVFCLLFGLAHQLPAAEHYEETVPRTGSVADPPAIENPTPARTFPRGDLSLQQARELALEHHPGLAAQQWVLAAEEGRGLQAGLPANPELAFEIENFAGADELEGFDGADATLAVSQLFELGGKRGKRQTIADSQTALALWDVRALRLDVLNTVTRAYIEVVAAQNRLSQAEGLYQLAGTVNTTVAERVQAGKVAPIEQTRSAVAAATARLEVENARRELEAARWRLAGHWGAETPGFGRATDNLDTSSALVTLEQLLPLLSRNPDIGRWEDELAKSRAEHALAEAGGVPDLRVSLGVRHFQENDSQALVAGLELPLPLFDRNQGARKAAAAAVHQVRQHQQATLDRARTELSAAYQQLSAAHAELSILTGELLPGAQSAFEATNLGYREGKFGLLDVLDAQRTLFEVRGQFVASLVSYHLARTDIERLIAQPLSEVLPLPATDNEVSR